MVTTRSGTQGTKPITSHPTKRKATSTTTKTSPPKKRKQDDANSIKPNHPKVEPKSQREQDGTILINRAPVLHLWAASVAHFTYPSLPWSTCLSAGAAVAAICAVSKGRAIGVMERKDKDEAKRNKTVDEDKFESIEVMRFHLRVKDGKAYVGPKPQAPAEERLKSKFGDWYDEVRNAFASALKGWEGKEDELEQRGFGMYEDFRPSVKAGTKGWGRKGELDLHRVKDTVSIS